MSLIWKLSAVALVQRAGALAPPTVDCEADTEKQQISFLKSKSTYRVTDGASNWDVTYDDLKYCWENSSEGNAVKTELLPSAMPDERFANINKGNGIPERTQEWTKQTDKDKTCSDLKQWLNGDPWMQTAIKWRDANVSGSFMNCLKVHASKDLSKTEKRHMFETYEEQYYNIVHAQSPNPATNVLAINKFRNTASILQYAKFIYHSADVLTGLPFSDWEDKVLQQYKSVLDKAFGDNNCRTQNFLYQDSPECQYLLEELEEASLTGSLFTKVKEEIERRRAYDNIQVDQPNQPLLQRRAIKPLDNEEPDKPNAQDEYQPDKPDEQTGQMELQTEESIKQLVLRQSMQHHTQKKGTCFAYTATSVMMQTWLQTFLDTSEEDSAVSRSKDEFYKQAYQLLIKYFKKEYGTKGGFADEVLDKEMKIVAKFFPDHDLQHVTLFDKLKKNWDIVRRRTLPGLTMEVAEFTEPLPEEKIKKICHYFNSPMNVSSHGALIMWKPGATKPEGHAMIIKLRETQANIRKFCQNGDQKPEDVEVIFKNSWGEEDQMKDIIAPLSTLSQLSVVINPNAHNESWHQAAAEAFLKYLCHIWENRLDHFQKNKLLYKDGVSLRSLQLNFSGEKLEDIVSFLKQHQCTVDHTGSINCANKSYDLIKFSKIQKLMATLIRYDVIEAMEKSQVESQDESQVEFDPNEFNLPEFKPE